MVTILVLPLRRETWELGQVWLAWRFTIISVLLLIEEDSGVGSGWGGVGGCWKIGRARWLGRLSAPLLLGQPISGSFLLPQLLLPDLLLLSRRLGDFGAGTDGRPPASWASLRKVNSSEL